MTATPLAASHSATFLQPIGSRSSHASKAGTGTTTHGRSFRTTRSMGQAMSVLPLRPASIPAAWAAIAALVPFCDLPDHLGPPPRVRANLLTQLVTTKHAPPPIP